MALAVFEDLQQKKIDRAQRLLDILTNIGPASELNKESEFIQKGVNIVSEHLPVLLQRIQDQQKLCNDDNQCIALLDEEIKALAGRKEQLGNLSIIEHADKVAAGAADLDVLVVSQALILITSRTTLSSLYSAAI